MKSKNVLLIGYGSMGKRHARNLMDIGIKPYILTRYPDGLDAIFLKDIWEVKDTNIDSCIIATPTADHLCDFELCQCLSDIPKKILIEKPLECSYLRGEAIKDIGKYYNVDIFVVYNMRFLKIFDEIKKFVKKQKDKIRIVEVVAGQDLREWRPHRDYAKSYSAHREKGGGVDLDLSHEIDYILWLFGNGFKGKTIFRSKISSLEIDSPDIFKLVLNYDTFIVDITLDYIRSPKERYIKILCEGGKNFYHDFNDDGGQSYKDMLSAFVDADSKGKDKFCSIDEGFNILKILEV